MPKYPADYTERVVIPLPTDEELSEELRRSLHSGADLNVSRMLAGTDDMYPAVGGLVEAVFQAKGVDPKLREIIILRCAKKLNSPYEWQANTRMARNVGCTDAEIDAVASDASVSGIADDLVLICAATDELTVSGTLTDATLLRLQGRYDPMICRKLVLIIAWFNLLSRFLNGCRVPLETTDKIGKNTTPYGA